MLTNYILCLVPGYNLYYWLLLFLFFWQIVYILMLLSYTINKQITSEKKFSMVNCINCKLIVYFIYLGDHDTKIQL